MVHEIGLFQGRLGFTKAIVLLERGCEEFSNIHGIGQIRFQAGNISDAFEEVRRVCEREGCFDQRDGDGGSPAAGDCGDAPGGAGVGHPDAGA
ncbi:MAG: TIR domain-containing protein [Acidimicrobiales bacterium]